MSDVVWLSADEKKSPDVLVYYLSAALAFTTILVALLAMSVYEIKRRNRCQCTGNWFCFYLAPVIH